MEEEAMSLSVNQSTSPLAVAEAFGPEVLGVARCGGKQEMTMVLKKVDLLKFLIAW